MFRFGMLPGGETVKISGFDFVGNNAALDLVNTVDNRFGPGPTVDLLEEPEDLLRWLEAAGIVTPREIESLQAHCARSKADCWRTLEEAKRLRTALWGIFFAISEDSPPPETSLEDLNEVLALGPLVRRVWTGPDKKVQDGLLRDADPLTSSVVAVAEIGAELLVSEKVERVRMCDRHDCSDLFYDTSKAGKRRWCDMAKCGNRSKVDRYHSKRKAGERY